MLTTAKKEMTDVYIRHSVTGRWIIVNAVDTNFAWSGSRWVYHSAGIPLGPVQVSNYATVKAALDAVAEFGFAVLVA